MLKRLLKKITYFRGLDNYPEFNLGSFILTLLCSFIIVIATFTQMPLGLLSIPEDAFIHPISFFSGIGSIYDIMRPYSYIPQIPAVIFIAALLGPRLGLLAVVLYVAIGLMGFPVFASGGGVKYATQLVFGYILGYCIGAYLVGKILSAKINVASIIRASIVGVASIHLFGILYLSIIMLLQHNSIFSVFGWVWALSGIQLPYDLIITSSLLMLIKPVRALLWVAVD